MKFIKINKLAYRATAFFLVFLLIGCSSKAKQVAAPAPIALPTSTNDNSTPTPTGSNYPPEEVTRFIEGCSLGYPPEFRNQCACMIQQIQARFTFAQYQEMTKQYGTNVAKAPGIPEVVQYCADKAPIATSQPPQPQPLAQNNNNPPYIVGQDGAFLGAVYNDPVGEKSICNQVGNYGSQVSPTSIRSQVGNYGSQISELSAYNPNATKPPLIIQNGQTIGILTKNRNLQGGTDPNLLLYKVCGK